MQQDSDERPALDLAQRYQASHGDAATTICAGAGPRFLRRGDSELPGRLQFA